MQPNKLQQHTKKLTFVSVDFDLMPIELFTGDKRPLATNAFIAFLPPSLVADRSNARLASMMRSDGCFNCGCYLA